MAEKHIYIFGEIGSENNIQTVSKQTKGATSEDTLIVHIHSPGGDVTEGFAIYDHLLSFGAKVETRIEGLCASIATIIAMAGSVRKMTENSTFFIHNPWTMTEGDSNELQNVADQLKTVENRIASFYSNKTKKSKEYMAQLMNQAEDITPEQAYKLGFITQIVKPIMALASYKANNQTNIDQIMSNFLTKMEAKIKSILNQEQPDVKNLDTTLEDGTAIVIEGDAITVGAAVTIAETGEPAPDGGHTTADGIAFITVDGVITEIMEAEDTTAPSIEALQAENSELKASVEALTAENTEIKAKFEQFVNSLEQKQPVFNRQIRSSVKSVAKSNDRTGGSNAILSKTKFSKTK
jgi:ATP-dependent protease ClpP protease subunit